MSDNDDDDQQLANQGEDDKQMSSGNSTNYSSDSTTMDYNEINCSSTHDNKNDTHLYKYNETNIHIEKRH
ncbi:hypothetical protein CRE_24818 [Caenorhabditis remanei]|uniref:Uncharacterized protein n=1 Tax=Caenorhabditis remanei TaxID=31234 RepID=E3NHN8_CAERE|nr:hypothetical protein CRE_24818 [Caenorhabditis remanei]